MSAGQSLMILLVSNAFNFSWIGFQSIRKYNWHYFMLRNSFQTEEMTSPSLHVVHRIWPPRLNSPTSALTSSPGLLLTGRMGKAVEISVGGLSRMVPHIPAGHPSGPFQSLFHQNLLLPMVGCWAWLILTCDFGVVDLEQIMLLWIFYSSLHHEIQLVS